MDEAFFRERYEADPTNKQKQSWKEYQDWVKTFYEGKRFPPVQGWAAREQEILAKLPADRRDAARAELAQVGRLLAAEWAKDNGVRKVSTGDLQSWGKRFGDAARDMDALTKALRDVEQELAKRA